MAWDSSVVPYSYLYKGMLTCSVLFVLRNYCALSTVRVFVSRQKVLGGGGGDRGGNQRYPGAPGCDYFPNSIARVNAEPSRFAR